MPFFVEILCGWHKLIYRAFAALLFVAEQKHIHFGLMQLHFLNSVVVLKKERLVSFLSSSFLPFFKERKTSFLSFGVNSYHSVGCVYMHH